MSESARQDVAFHQVLWKLGAGGPILLQGQAGLREQTLLCAACHTFHVHFLGQLQLLVAPKPQSPPDFAGEQMFSNPSSHYRKQTPPSAHHCSSS